MVQFLLPNMINSFVKNPVSRPNRQEISVPSTRNQGYHYKNQPQPRPKAMGAVHTSSKTATNSIQKPINNRLREHQSNNNKD